MKKVKAIIGLLVLLSVVYTIPIGSSRSEVLSEELWEGPPLPEEPVEPPEENITPEFIVPVTCINTTNPYTNIIGTPLDERYLCEGPLPLNVLVFGDEEAIVKERWSPEGDLNWEDYAVWQIERGDEALVALFGIDVRVIDFLTWDSDDSKNDIHDLHYELWYENEHYLRVEYNGTGIVIDAIIGITEQENLKCVGGLAHSLLNVIILKWWTYWANDNLVQHEVSHLFQVEDKWEIGVECIMATWDKENIFCVAEDGHHWSYVLELGIDVDISWLTNEYCTSCSDTVNDHKDRFPIPLGDADLDGDVDIHDFYVWQKYGGETYPSRLFWEDNVDPDFDNDGKVQISDFYIWLKNAIVYLTVLGEEDGASLYDVGYVYIDDKYVGNLGSTFRVIRGETYMIGVTDFWESGDTGWRYNFTNWNDGSTDNPRTIRVEENTTITAHFYKKKCPGDVDGDGDVDVGDLYKVQLALFTVPGDPDWNSEADVDGDGKVGVGAQRKVELNMFNKYP